VGEREKRLGAGLGGWNQGGKICKWSIEGSAELTRKGGGTLAGGTSGNQVTHGLRKTPPKVHSGGERR